MALVALAEVDEATYEFIKSEGAVIAITAAMEHHPDDEDLLIAGARALGVFADEKDLQHAMDTVGRSRMEEQTPGNMAMTGQAIGILGNLALLEKNIEYIVQEGGIPVLLSVINGASSDADRSENAAKILESGIRALGRLLGTEKTGAEFIREGGLETLIALIRAHPHKERVMNACVTAADHLIQTKVGFKAAVDSDLVNCIIEVVEVFIYYLLSFYGERRRKNTK